MEKKKHIFNKVFLIVGAVALTAAIALFVGGMTAVDWDFKKLSTVHFIQKEFTAEEAPSSLTVRYTSANVQIRHEEREGVLVSYPVRTDMEGREKAQVDVGIDNGKLTIREKKSGFDFFAFQLETPVLTVTLPANAPCALDIRTESGDISLSSAGQIQGTDMAFVSENGDIDVRPQGGISLTGEMKFESGSGDVSAANISAKALTFTTDVGDAAVENVQAETVSVTTDVGDALLKGKIDAGTLRIRTDVGGVLFAEDCLADAQKIDIATDVGDVKVRGALAGAREDYTLFLTANVGSSNFPSGGEGARQVTIVTDTGDISLRFEK